MPNGSAKLQSQQEHAEPNMVGGMMTTIDYAAAILLLTGQITTTGIFMLPEGLSLSCTGPILGGTRLEGTRFWAKTALDGIDILLALLLILGEVSVIGPYISYRSLYIVISGPPFRVPSSGLTRKKRQNRTATVYLQLRRALKQAFLEADFEQFGRGN